MSELLRPNVVDLEGVDPICVRDMLIEEKINLHGLSNWNGLNESNPSRLYIIREIEGLVETRDMTKSEDFANRLDELGKEYYELLMLESIEEAELVQVKMKPIQRMHEYLRFFWHDGWPLDIGSLYTLQRVVNRPVFSEDWRFREQVRPPHQFSEEYGNLNDLYQKLEIGRQIRVSERWAGEELNPQAGKTGEIMAFTTGLQAQFNMDYLIITFKDNENWLHQAYLYTIDLV